MDESIGEKRARRKMAGTGLFLKDDKPIFLAEGGFSLEWGQSNGAPFEVRCSLIAPAHGGRLYSKSGIVECMGDGKHILCRIRVCLLNPFVWLG